jgi:hypothetical protein
VNKLSAEFMRAGAQVSGYVVGGPLTLRPRPKGLDMRVDGREISVSGNLLQPLTRRTNDILRLAATMVFFAIVIAGSLITRPQWVALEKSISEIVGVLTPTQSDLVYLAYGVAILVLPFAILIGLVASRQWKLLGAYAAAGLLAVLPLSISGTGISAPRWHFDLCLSAR